MATTSNVNKVADTENKENFSTTKKKKRCWKIEDFEIGDYLMMECMRALIVYL